MHLPTCGRESSRSSGSQDVDVRNAKQLCRYAQANEEQDQREIEKEGESEEPARTWDKREKMDKKSWVFCSC